METVELDRLHFPAPIKADMAQLRSRKECIHLADVLSWVSDLPTPLLCCAPTARGPIPLNHFRLLAALQILRAKGRTLNPQFPVRWIEPGNRPGALMAAADSDELHLTLLAMELSGLLKDLSPRDIAWVTGHSLSGIYKALRVLRLAIKDRTIRTRFLRALRTKQGLCPLADRLAKDKAPAARNGVTVTRNDPFDFDLLP